VLSAVEVIACWPLRAGVDEILRFAQDDNLIEQIFSPLIVGVAHQAHDVATGVEIERARFTRRLHVGFVWKLVAFAAIAGMTAGDQVLPGGEAAARAWNHVIQREFAGG